MFYVYRKDTNEVTVACNYKPNREDLLQNNRDYIESEETWINFDGSNAYYDTETKRLKPKGEKPDEYHVWSNNKWVFDPELKKETVSRNAHAEVESMKYVVNQKITVLQDAVDLDMATEEEKALFTAYRRLRVELSRWKYPEAVPDYPENHQP